MTIQWQHPWVLWALLVVPSVWMAARLTRAQASRWSSVASAPIRGIILALLILALAEPHTMDRRTGTEPPVVVFLVDHSNSVGADVEAATPVLARYREALPAGTYVEELAFAGTVAPKGKLDSVNADETDIAEALRASRTVYSECQNRQVILISDGRSTSGDPTSIARELQAAGTRVHACPIGTPTPRGPRIASLTPPPFTAVGQPARAELRLASDWPAELIVQVMDASGIEQQHSTVAVKGDRVMMLTVQPHWRGVQEWKVVVTDSSSSPPTAMSASLPFYAVGAPRVMVLDSAPEELGYLQAALEPLQLELDVRSLSQLPSQLHEYDPYDAVLFSDWPAPILTADQAGALSDYVRKRGGGLLFLGGTRVQPKQWHASAVEALLPVTFEPEPRKREAPLPPSHVCFVIDRSGSMAGGKLEMVKLAFARCMNSLPKGAHVSVIAFDYAAYEIVRQRPLSEKEDLIRAVNAIGIGGGTLMGPAISDGVQLLKSEDQARYMVILTDGQTGDEGDIGLWQYLAEQMRRNNIRVTGIGIGHGASPTVLQYLAVSTGGEYRFCKDASEVPAVFLRQAETITREAEQRSEAFKPQPGPDATTIRSIQPEALPELDGCVSAEARPDPLVQVQLLRDERRALLASWYCGVGRTVAFTSDAKNLWASRWVASPGTAPFWAELVRWVIGDTRRFRADMEPRVTGDDVRILVRVVEAESETPASGLRATGSIAPLGEEKESTARMTCRELRPGLYEFTGKCRGRGANLCQLLLKAGAETAADLTALVCPQRTAELAATGPDKAALENIVREGGGLINPLPDQLATYAAAPAPHEIVRSSPYWPTLTLLAVLLWPVDVAVRRLTNCSPQSPSDPVSA